MASKFFFCHSSEKWLYCKPIETFQATEGGDLDGTGFQEESGIEVSERDQAAFAEFMNRY